MTLKQKIETSDNKRHDLLTWITTNIQDLSSKDDFYFEKTENVEYWKRIQGEITEFLRFLAGLEDSSVLDSHYISVRLSHLFTLCLMRLKRDYAGMIFDSAELLTNILLEEDVSVTEAGVQSKGKKGKSSSKKKATHTHSFARDTAAVILTQLFEVFPKEVSSLVPLVCSALFKNLKKALEKTKYYHATYIVTLMNLFNSILRNVDESVMEGSHYISKFTKLSKSVFEDISTNDNDYPVDFVSSMIDCWGILFQQKSFIKNQDDLMGTLYSKFSEGSIGVYGFSNDKTRIYTAKTLAEVLFNYQFSRGLITPNEAFKFYVKLFIKAETRDVKAGCFESIVHFITLNFVSDRLFLSGCRYLYILKSLSSIISPVNLRGKKLGTISRYLRYFRQLNRLMLPYLSESSQLQMLLTLMGNASEDHLSETYAFMKAGDLEMQLFIDFDNLTNNEWFILLQLDFLEHLLTSLSSSFGTDDSIVEKVKSKLMLLATSDVYSLRIHAVKPLKILLRNFPDLLSGIIESSLTILSDHFAKSEKQNLSFAKMHGYAFVIANLIDCADKDYVSYELIMRISVFATSFIKKHTTTTTSDLYFKGLVCWILMIGLMNYKDEQYLNIQTSQLFLFWKVLLTHTFTYRDEEELHRNLEIRAHALACLLTFLSNSKVDNEMAKQVSYLLTKCSNFNHSVTLKSQQIDNILLINENRILQIYLKLQKFLRNDFNNSLLMVLLKNFSDPNLYSEPSQSVVTMVRKKMRKDGSSNDEAEKDKVLENKVDTLLRQNDDFAYGLSSKVSIKGSSNMEPKSQRRIGSQMSSSWSNNSNYWFHTLDSNVTTAIPRVLEYDSLVLLYEPKSCIDEDEYLPKITTSLVDLSMEIFSSVFPYLNAKIQYSVVETLNLSLFSKATTPLRNVAIAANICSALHNSLEIFEEHGIPLDANVGKLIIDSLRKIEYYNDSYLTNLKASCMGLVCAAVRRSLDEGERGEFISNQINILIKTLVDMNEPFSRMFNSLALASVYKFNSQYANFSRIFDVLIALVDDPHPIIHSWSLRALYTLLEKHLVINLPTIQRILSSIEGHLSDPNYGLYGPSTLRYNYNREYNSHISSIDVIKTLTEKIGPLFTELDRASLDSFQNIVVGSILSNNISERLSSLKIFEDISTFKLDNILEDVLFINSAKSIISSAILTGVGSAHMFSVFCGSGEIIAQTSSLDGALMCFSLFEQLFKLSKGPLFMSTVENMSWRYLALFPSSPEVCKYLNKWVACTEENSQWFDKLCLTFNISYDKLFSGFFKAIDTLLEGKKVKATVEGNLKDGELEGDNVTVAPNETKPSTPHLDEVPWRTKRVILQLVANLCSTYEFNRQLLPSVISKLPELINLSSQASASRIKEINILGLQVLDYVVKMSSHLHDMELANQSILKLQEAQITSALMPSFHKGKSPDVISMTIGVCAEVINSGIAESPESGRIFQLLVKLLGCFKDSSASVTIGDCVIMTKTALRKVELSVLSCWAKIIEAAISTNDRNMIDFTRNYWHIVIPLWILSLREYMIVRYAGSSEGGPSTDSTPSLVESNTTRLELYEPIWLVFVKVLGSILGVENGIIREFLSGEELEGFIFVLSATCLEEISKNSDDTQKRIEVLSSLRNLLKCGVLLKTLLNDEIFDEVTGVFDRSIAMGTTKERDLVVDIIGILIETYIEQNTDEDDFLQDIDKLYELLRLLITILVSLLPFINYNDATAAGSNAPQLSSDELALIKKTVQVFERSINRFSTVFKVDLYACLLFILGRIYLSEYRDNTVPLFLPMLKSITKDLMETQEHSSLLDVFYESTRDSILYSLNDESALATFLILVTGGFSGFSEDDFTRYIEILLKKLNTETPDPVASAGTKNVVGKYSTLASCRLVSKLLIEKALELKYEEMTSVFIIFVLGLLEQLVGEVVKKGSPKVEYAVALYLSFLGQNLEIMEEESIDIQELISTVVAKNPEAFKEAMVSVLDEEQRKKIGNIVKLQGVPKYDQDDEKAVKLKSFV